MTRSVKRGTSYFGVRDVRHVERDLDRFREAGLTAILHTFSERDQRFFEETMVDIVSASTDRGFTTYVISWGVWRVFGGEALAEFIGTHPEVGQVLSTGDRLPTACFNAPELRDFMREGGATPPESARTPSSETNHTSTSRRGTALNSRRGLGAVVAISVKSDSKPNTAR